VFCHHQVARSTEHSLAKALDHSRQPDPVTNDCRIRFIIASGKANSTLGISMSDESRLQALRKAVPVARERMIDADFCDALVKI
jgi:hypothetical protein